MVKKKRLSGILWCLWLWIPVALTALVLFCLFSASFMGEREFSALFFEGTGGLHLLPERFTLRQYRAILWESPQFLYYFWNSMALSVPTLLGIWVVSAMGGYGFRFYRFRGKRPLFFLLMILMMLPYQVTLAPSFLVMHALGLVGKRLAVILFGIFSPFGVFLMYQFMGGVPKETIESARVEGAGEWTVFFHIALPQTLPGMAALAVLNLVETWGIVEPALILLQKESLYPLSLALSAMENPAVIFASSVLYVLPILIVFLMGRDSLVDGIRKSVIRRGGQ